MAKQRRQAANPPAQAAKPAAGAQQAQQQAQAGPGGMRRVLSAMGRMARSRTGMVAGGAIAGMAGGEILRHAYDVGEGTSYDDLARGAVNDDLRSRADQELEALARERRAESLQSSIAQNLQQLQMTAPDLYMRVATGRRLPQGAIVIGGEPRHDLLQELGEQMAQGGMG